MPLPKAPERKFKRTVKSNAEQTKKELKSRKHEALERKKSQKRTLKTNKNPACCSLQELKSDVAEIEQILFVSEVLQTETVFTNVLKSKIAKKENAKKNRDETEKEVEDLEVSYLSTEATNRTAVMKVVRKCRKKPSKTSSRDHGENDDTGYSKRKQQ